MKIKMIKIASFYNMILSKYGYFYVILLPFYQHNKLNILIFLKKHHFYKLRKRLRKKVFENDFKTKYFYHITIGNRAVRVGFYSHGWFEVKKSTLT